MFVRYRDEDPAVTDACVPRGLANCVHNSAATSDTRQLRRAGTGSNVVVLEEAWAGVANDSVKAVVRSREHLSRQGWRFASAFRR